MEFAGSTQNPKKITETPNLPSRTKIFPKNYVSYLKSVKEPKIRIGATRRNLQVQPKMFKKNCRNIKSTNQNNNFPKKTMFRTLKV
jgi:hypothetical protein